MDGSVEMAGLACGYRWKGDGVLRSFDAMAAEERLTDEGANLTEAQASASFRATEHL